VRQNRAIILFIMIFIMGRQDFTLYPLLAESSILVCGAWGFRERI